jgi:hypothetical protein
MLVEPVDDFGHDRFGLRCPQGSLGTGWILPVGSYPFRWYNTPVGLVDGEMT